MFVVLSAPRVACIHTYNHPAPIYTQTQSIQTILQPTHYTAGDAEENAALLREVLAPGEHKNAKRDSVVLNAGMCVCMCACFYLCASFLPHGPILNFWAWLYIRTHIIPINHSHHHNTAAGLYAYGDVSSIEEGVKKAYSVLASGAAIKKVRAGFMVDGWAMQYCLVGWLFFGRKLTRRHILSHTHTSIHDSSTSGLPAPRNSRSGDNHYLITRFVGGCCVLWCVCSWVGGTRGTGG